MKIIAGTARGHNLITLKGIKTRPTLQRVKEAMFSSIQFRIANADVLDLFAGSGALGAEALSRGANSCVFVDCEKEAVLTIEKNLLSAKLTNNYIIINQNSLNFAEICNEKFDIIFLDPPYNEGLCDKILQIIYDRELLREGGIIICEISGVEIIGNMCYNVLKDVKYGNMRLVYLGGKDV